MSLSAHEQQEADKRRLRWRSRRGLLELDIVLEKFLAHDFEQLSASDLLHYDDLLLAPDNDLLDWVDGRAEPSNPAWLPVLQRLRFWMNNGVG